MRSVFKVLCGSAVLVMAAAAPHGVSAASCPPAGFRWLEDCSELSASSQSGLDRLRYIGLDGGRRRWVSLGGEYRFRIDAQADALYGIHDADPYVTVQQRLLVHADVHDRSGVRVFGQLSVAEEDGRVPRRTIGESDVDVAQLFADAPFKAGRVAVLARAGRQELDLGGNFLLGVRNAALRRSFNGGLIRAGLGRYSINAFYGQPTQIRPGAFDDRGNPGERLGYVAFDAAEPELSWGVFRFHRQRDVQSFPNARGADERATTGGRFRWNRRPWIVSGQFAVQTGHVGTERVRAWAGQVDVRRALTASGRTAIAGQLLSFSGDRRAGDGRYQGFDALYPNLNISNVPLFMSANLTTGSLLAETRLGRVTVGALAMAAFRTTAGDAVYSQGAIYPLARSGGRGQAVLAQVNAQLPVGRRLIVSAALAHAEPLAAVRSLGGRNVDFVRTEIIGRF